MNDKYLEEFYKSFTEVTNNYVFSQDALIEFSDDGTWLKLRHGNQLGIVTSIHRVISTKSLDRSQYMNDLSDYLCKKGHNAWVVGTGESIRLLL